MLQEKRLLLNSSVSQHQTDTLNSLLLRFLSLWIKKQGQKKSGSLLSLSIGIPKLPMRLSLGVKQELEGNDAILGTCAVSGARVIQ